MGSRFRDAFLDYLCQFEGLWFFGVALLLALLLLSLFSLAYVEDGTATATILQLDLIILIGGLALAGTVLYACRNR